MSPDDAARERRADARRNVERIVDAASVVLRRDGPDAPLDRIAREAGTGSATLHRHFSGRRALLLAVFDDTIRALADDATRAREYGRPGEELWPWLDRLVRHCASDAGLAAALRTAPPPAADAPSWAPLANVGIPLLQDAIAAGRADPAVAIDDLLMFVDAIASSCPLRPDAASRRLAILRDGAGISAKQRPS